MKKFIKRTFPKPQPIVFFRDDDVGELNANIVRLTELFQKHEIPLSLEIIPKNIQQEFVNYYNSLTSKKLFDVGQHGYAHIPYRENDLNKGEFGQNRKTVDKEKDIAAGWEMMEKYFNNDLQTKTFTPPWGLMDEETYRILQKLNYEAFSCINKSKGSNFIKNLFMKSPEPLMFQNHNMINLSVSVDNMRNFEKRIPRKAEELIKKFEESIGGSKYIGIMLHDKIMNNEAFEALETFLHYLKTNKVKVMNMTQIIKETKNA